MFKNRIDAGEKLWEKVSGEIIDFESWEIVVLSIPRGGIIIGKILAEKIDCKHDVIAVGKISAPNRDELAIGACGQTKGSLYLNRKIIKDLKIDKEYVEKEKKKIERMLAERERKLRRNNAEINLKDKVVIIADDGVATGATMVAGVREIFNREPKKVICTAPVFSFEALKLMEREADCVIAGLVEKMFYAVSSYYEEFEQISDEQVRKIFLKQ